MTPLTPLGGGRQLTPLGQTRVKAAAGSWRLGPWPGFPLAAAINPGDCVAAYRAQANSTAWGAGPVDLAASYSNLANPGTYDAAPGVAPAWAGATGWGWNGSSQYLTTGLVPDPLLTQTWTWIIQFTGALAGDCPMGTLNVPVNRYWQLFPVTGAGDHQYVNVQSLVVADVAVPSGNMAAAGRNCYLNGVADGTIPALTGGTVWPEMYIGARNSAGVATNHFAGNIQALAIYSITLDAFQIAALGTVGTGAMANL